MSLKNLTIVGCGELGRRLAQQLQPEPYQCIGLKRTPQAPTSNLEYRQADATSLSSLKKALPDYSHIVIVTMVPSERSDEGYRRAYVEAVSNVLDALEGQQKPELILFVSSTRVYGQNSGEWVNEHSTTTPQNFAGRRLLEAEQRLLNSQHNGSVVRFSGIYGPGRHHLIRQVAQGQLGSPETPAYTNRIHAHDCAAVLKHLILMHSQNQRLEARYLASDCEPTLDWPVKQWLAQQLKEEGNPLSHNSTLPPSSDVLLSNGKQCSNQLLLQSGFEFRYPSFRQGYPEVITEFNAQRTNL